MPQASLDCEHPSAIPAEQTRHDYELLRSVRGVAVRAPARLTVPRFRETVILDMPIL